MVRTKEIRLRLHPCFVGRLAHRLPARDRVRRTRLPLFLNPKPLGSPISQPVSKKNNYPASRCKSRRNAFASPRFTRPIAPVFSLSGCETIAPVTHQDQANRSASAGSPWQCRTAPEKRWCRPASQLLTVSVAAVIGSTPCWLAFRAIASIALAAVPSVQSVLVAASPTPVLAHRHRLDRHAKQRVTLNVVCSFNM